MSVSAVQLRILVVAIAIVTVGQLVLVSTGDDRTASRASIAEPLTGAFTVARGQSEQPPTGLRPQATEITRFLLARKRRDVMIRVLNDFLVWSCLTVLIIGIVVGLAGAL